MKSGRQVEDLFVSAEDANDAAVGMRVIIQRICSDEQRAGVSNTFAFAVLKSCGNLRRSLLAVGCFM